MSEHARVLFFATLRDLTGVRQAVIEYPTGTTIAGIKVLVLRNYPALEHHMETLIVAVNHEFAADEDVVANDAEIAMFPPVSGGAGNLDDLPTIGEITEHEIDLNAILAKITRPTTGGVCTFTGIVRGVTSGKIPHETQSLEYEAYQAMAEAKLRQICTEIRTKWTEVEGLAIIQRVGRLKVGEISVMVACAASHRDRGIFEAARYGIDRVKEIVPVWKKELGKDGAVWVEGEYLPHKGD